MMYSVLSFVRSVSAVLNPMMASISGGIRAIHMGIVANHVSSRNTVS